MKKAGIRELKIHLSQYLRKVKEGEDILITEHGKVIARIVPSGSAEKKEDPRSALFQLASKGYILIPQQLGKPAGKPKRVKINGAPFSDAVIEGRR